MLHKSPMWIVESKAAAVAAADYVYSDVICTAFLLDRFVRRRPAACVLRHVDFIDRAIACGAAE